MITDSDFGSTIQYTIALHGFSATTELVIYSDCGMKYVNMKLTDAVNDDDDI